MTEYTEFIEDGDVTTAKDFLKLCSRKFGVYENSKDEPLSPTIPVTITKDPKYQQAVDAAKTTLDTAIHCTDWATELSTKITSIETEIADVEEDIEDIETANAEKKTAYDAILEELATYSPDSPYNKVKEFAKNQIDISVKYLPSTTQLEKQKANLEAQKEKLEGYEAAEYKDIVLKELSEKLAEAIKESMQEDVRIAERQKYLDGFWDSIQDL